MPERRYLLAKVFIGTACPGCKTWRAPVLCKRIVLCSDITIYYDAITISVLLPTDVSTRFTRTMFDR
jgi:hypothetical protein